jgi:poly-gamma-glutamate synthesis protein (capsule biosynthesis protein)
VVTLFLCGDVMLGRGVDQLRPQHVDPALHESYVRDARAYVALAERASGPMPRGVGPAYVWGDALAELTRVAPAVRIVNLETAITTSDAYWPHKPIHYRMHPANVDSLTAARIDVCTLANNHVLDYGTAGLIDTVDTLRAAGVKSAGAGCNAEDAERPATVAANGAWAVSVYSLGCANGGVFATWAATSHRAGVSYLSDLSDAIADRVLERIGRTAHAHDLVIASLHWGSNWGYDVPRSFVRFAHRLIDGGVALVHGHSSHHPRPIEVYRGRLILYGCGDFLTDYEGITGYEEYRPDLALMYFPTVDQNGELAELRLTPLRQRRFRATLAHRHDAEWLQGTLERASAWCGTRIALLSAPDDVIQLEVRR